MIKKILFLCIFHCFVLCFSQNLKPVAQKISDYHSKGIKFEKYDLFKTNTNAEKMAEYRKAATDITSFILKPSNLQTIIKEKPEFIEMSFPFDGDKTITVELYKNEIFTTDFKVKTGKDENSGYKPGVYYRGIIKGNNQSVVAFSFFENDVVGVASAPTLGNVVVGKVKNSQDFVSYSESKLTGSNPFVCGADELKENKRQKVFFNPANTTNNKTLTTNCVRFYYEIAYKAYQSNGYNLTTATNWMTAMHNNVATLYFNDGVKVALSEIYVWTTPTPYSESLGAFANYRTSFNGDLAIGITTQNNSAGVAYLNSLCTQISHGYTPLELSYSNIPTYSWNINVLTHESGHILGSPHTHACVWNGNNTPIDGCGPLVGYSEGCMGPIPSQGGTMMSYCHLAGVGIDFSYGFGPQPAALIRNTVDSKSCLGTDCLSSQCAISTAGINITNVSQNSVSVSIIDPLSTSWKYRITKPDGTQVSVGITNSQNFNITGLQPATHYRLYIVSGCLDFTLGGNYQPFMTDADWCSGIQFTDTGGTTDNYNNDSLIKTFYPTPGNKLTMNFAAFDLWNWSPTPTVNLKHYMNIYNGPSTSSPLFPNGSELTGTTIPGPFTSTHPSGAITVEFVSGSGILTSGWIANFSCQSVLGVENTNEKDKNILEIYPNPVKNRIIISSKENLKSYKIFDKAGRLIISGPLVKGNKAEINLSSIQVGNYIISIETEKRTISKKLIKQ